MVTLRCTQRLLRRLRCAPQLDAVSPSNRLGDWYANVLNIGRTQLVLCVSEKTLLPALLSAREYRTLPTRLRLEVEWTLGQIGIAAEVLAAELAAMEAIEIGRTQSRVVLGSMNQMSLHAFYRLTDPRRTLDLRATSLHLAESIYSQLGQRRREYGSPIEATILALR